jgi:SAM-dependent MidA family methyltransferase
MQERGAWPGGNWPLASTLRLDEFMARANAIYYANCDPFSDFTTSPEISQVFGELLGAWSAVVWQQMGAPPRFTFVEAGPGRGSLMQDALRSLRLVAPGFVEACDVRFIERSPRLRAEQERRVPHATWHDDLADMRLEPTILLANEFLDALPIRQFVRVAHGWVERYVCNGVFVGMPAAAPGREAPIGSVVELGEASGEWVSTLARRLVALGGAALILDYGPSESLLGDSFQALRSGRPADPLVAPGSADLTAHVDFGAVARSACLAGASVWGPINQGDFLRKLGLWERIAALAAANPGRADHLRESAQRLASPARMGELFKVICVAHPDLPAPPGFEP